MVDNRDRYVKREVEERGEYRQLKRKRVWSDETYVNKNHVQKKCLSDDKMIINQPSGQ